MGAAGFNPARTRVEIFRPGAASVVPRGDTQVKEYDPCGVNIDGQGAKRETFRLSPALCAAIGTVDPLAPFSWSRSGPAVEGVNKGT